MNKFIFILFLLGASTTLLCGQKLIFQSNNAMDLKQYEPLVKATNITQLTAKLANVVGNNPDYDSLITIQVTFFDPYALGGFKLKASHTNSVNYVNTWKDTYAGEDRIMFFFEKNNDRYVFRNFAITQKIEDGQIPEIVRNYIQEEILEKQTDVAEIVRRGINAVKNAYDRSFQQKLIERAPNMLLCRYYYKGYTCITTDSYYFQNLTINRSPEELGQFIVYLHQGTYYDVYLKNWNTVRANVFDKLIGHELLSVNSTIPSANLLYANDGTSYRHIDILNINFDTKDLFDYNATGYASYESVVQSNKFSYMEQLKNSKEVMTIDSSKYGQVMTLKENNQTMPVTHATLYKLIKDEIIGPNSNHLQNGIDAEDATALTNEMVWGHPDWRNNYQTWCNVYANYLSRYIYGKVGDDYMVPYGQLGKSANEIFDYFSSSLHYIDLKDKDYNEDKIWQLINKGYPVYFSWKKTGGSGHIETGFPSNTGMNVWNGKIFGQDSTDNTILDKGNNKLMIGAGSTVGYKTYSTYKYFTNKATPFLALKYLSEIYE
jgi:hypothetical protein